MKLVRKRRRVLETVISMVSNATDTGTRDITIGKVFEVIRTGGTKLKGQITRIQNRFESEMALSGGDRKRVKLAVDALKKQLPAVTWSGQFSKRENGSLVKHSGFLCADIDSLAERLPEVRTKLQASPHVFAQFVSPSALGLKSIVRIPADVSTHGGSFRAVQEHFRDLAGVEIDGACKDPARLCFMSYDPEIYVNVDAREIEPLPEPLRLKPKAQSNGEYPLDLSLRERIAYESLGEMTWSPEKGGHFCGCPGESLHTSLTSKTHTIVYLDGAPTIKCQHNSCAKILEAFNLQLRSSIAKAENRAKPEPPPRVEVDEPEIELPPPAPAQYVPPPLDLLPSVFQEYVIASSESLDVDVSLVFLPLLSAVGAAIGVSRWAYVKNDFIEPPSIWTGCISPSGTIKSPALKAATFATREHERDLVHQNKMAGEIYDNDLAEWKLARPKTRGPEPAKPIYLTCLCDDVTIEAIGDALNDNRRGVLVGKDELSGFFASFDAYRAGSKGLDVNKWLQLHSGVPLILDRRTDHRHLRIFHPTVGITGTIQRGTFKRVATPEFFERGLIARFFLAYPTPRRIRFNEKEVPVDLRNAVAKTFDSLWLLAPRMDDRGDMMPDYVRLCPEALEIFKPFYNAAFLNAFEGDEREAPAWSKLAGGSTRLALVGQLLHDATATHVNGAVMQSACSLAEWFGKEATRIYARLSETDGQRDRRGLIGFIQKRGGAVYERDVMQGYWRLKNDKEGTERELSALVKDGTGKWETVDHSGGRGRPTRKFQILLTSTSTQFLDSRGKTTNSVDVDAPSNEKITSPAKVGDELGIASL